MNELHIICLTKSYNREDFETWYRWYSKSMVDHIHVIDNESPVELKSIVSRSQDSYEKLEGWPNQWKLFDEILKTNRYDFQDGDYIFFADDDEFLWFNDINFSTLKSTIDNEFSKTQLDLLLIPQILMSSKNLLEYRTKSYIETNYYRRNDYSSQGKAVIRYFTENKYSFSKDNAEIGHVPYYKNVGAKEWLRYSKVVGSDNSKTTYGIVDYNADLRLYHFHLKSIDDWNKKWERGSAACKEHPYKQEIKDNYYYGSYYVIDTSVFLKN